MSISASISNKLNQYINTNKEYSTNKKNRKIFIAKFGLFLNATLIATIELIAYTALMVPTILAAPFSLKPMQWCQKKAVSCIHVFKKQHTRIKSIQKTDFGKSIQVANPLLNIMPSSACMSTIHIFQEGESNNNEAIKTLKKIHGWPVATIEKRLRPNELSQAGFLGPKESLIEVLLEDNTAVLNQGLTHKHIANTLDAFLKQVDQTKGKCSDYTGVVCFRGAKYSVEKTQHRGFQENPFAHEGESLPRSSSILTIKSKNDPKIKIDHVTHMLPQLIRDYGFYEGKQTPYRVAPQDLIALFQLKPNYPQGNR